MRKRLLHGAVPVALGLALVSAARAQTDNFDSGTLDSAWKRSNFNPALVSTSFPDANGGKAFRVQANPVPGAAPAAAMFYRDQVYTNFYMAVDLVNWPGTDKNQAVVLVARGTLSANPATTTGIIMNYDTSQYGENPTDRRQGQLQINMVTNNPPFGTKTLATAEVTFEPGRSYRLIFTGEGSQYTAKAYDHHDMTQPLITIRADDDVQGSQPGGGNVFFDAGFRSGVSGLLAFSRQGQSGTADITFDNYYAGPTDPNTAAGMALAHPVAGTPVVESRVPAERFKNFHNPADGLQFTVRTHTTDLVDAAATKLWLNGADVSAQLVKPANGSNVVISLPGSALAANTVYSAQLEVQDASGTKRSTNTFWFDTFSEGYLGSAEVKVIEAEEYNYNNGEFQADPIPVSGVDTNGVLVNGGGVGYYEMVGTEGVDFHDNRTSPEGQWAVEYRSVDPVGLSMGMFPEIADVNEPSDLIVRRSDNVRAKYASSNLLEIVVHRTEPGEWLNYTRQFSGTYMPYLRVASFGATEVELHQVTSDPKAPEQASTKLGTFKVPNNFARYHYRYVPLVNDQGAPATVSLNGAQTLRLQFAGTEGQDQRKIAVNYMLLAPFSQPAVKLLASSAVGSAFQEVAGATVNAQARTITAPASGAAQYYQISSGTQTRITGAQIAGGSLTLSYE